LPNERITGIEAETLTHLRRLDRADHALSAPNAGIGETAYYPTFATKAAAMTFQLIKGHPLVDGNKRVGYVCLLEFVRRNGYGWEPPAADGPERLETVATIEGVANGTITQEDLAEWIENRLFQPDSETQ